MELNPKVRLRQEIQSLCSADSHVHIVEGFSKGTWRAIGKESNTERY